MFKCEQCNKSTKSGQPINRVVINKRRRTYETKVFKGDKEVGVELVEGWEITKELDLCPTCYRQVTGKEPTLITLPEKKKFVPLTFNKKDERPWKNPRRNTKKPFSKEEPLKIQKKKPIIEVVNPLKSTRE